MFDGILGMSPYGDSKSNSIVAALTKEKIIEEETATFCLHKQHKGISTVTFGGVPNDCRSDKTYYLMLNEANDQWWTVRLKGLNYGKSNIK